MGPDYEVVISSELSIPLPGLSRNEHTEERSREAGKNCTEAECRPCAGLLPDKAEDNAGGKSSGPYSEIVPAERATTLSGRSYVGQQGLFDPFSKAIKQPIKCKQ